ncbi:putative RNA-directed DNA polymerase from transposon X-element [Trichonephila clavipes]|uniref:Putative RNA-directed DNA polymerase from transposon X-element n=1 Tax=Trichonephila clavipes TaxID=2585209 RepID=A0A8X6RNN9_TRICX|nr:putative RNA-directed DNA polymerase from transposon X-element [Trichonephila clavipes]
MGNGKFLQSLTFQDRRLESGRTKYSKAPQRTQSLHSQRLVKSSLAHWSGNPWPLVEASKELIHGDHARLSSTTGPTIMSDFSENMEVSPTRQAQVATCEKLRDTVTGISALHMSLHDGRSPSPQNSFTELYRMSTQAMIKKKEEMVSELKTPPPCTRNDCNEHKIPTTSVVEEINLKVPPPELTNKKGIKNKKLCKKRKNKGKESTEEFNFPKKTVRPVSPTSSQDPIVTSNNFSDLEQDVEHPLPTTNQVTAEVVTPKIKLPHPIMLKIKPNFREQIKCINEKFPKIRNRTVNDVVKMFTNDHEENRNLIHFLESDKDFEFYIIKRNIDKPIKAVIKGLPSSSKIEDITKDIADEGFVIDSCTQLIYKRTKKELPYFLVILPRNDKNSKIFDLAHLNYLQVKVEGYLVRGITQCFNCNNFFHTAANCFMKPRCL